MLKRKLTYPSTYSSTADFPTYSLQNRYGTLLAGHFDSTVLNHLPESQRGMDDEVPMVPNMSE